MGIRDFLFSKTFVKHFLLSVVIALFSVFLILKSLKLYTRHGEAIAVPELNGLTEKEATPILKKLHLRYAVIDSTYTEEIIAGGVVDQVPDPGHKVKRNRTILLTINAVAPEQVPIPRLTDISLRQSLSQLETSGLIPGSVTYKPSEFKNLVLQAQINGRDVVIGQLVSKGTRVDLIVGSGEGSQLLVFLPNVTGLTRATAQQIIAEAGLATGSIIFDSSVFSYSDSISARVWRQNPDYRSVLNVNSGSSVDLWLTVDESKLTSGQQEEQTNDDDFNF